MLLTQPCMHQRQRLWVHLLHRVVLVRSSHLMLRRVVMRRSLAMALKAMHNLPAEAPP
mgnify:CR=1 FL=1